MDEKGLYGIVTSSEMTPEEVHGLYTSRGASETQYMLIKSELGYGKIRVQYTPGVSAKFSVGFIASIIRYEIECSAKSMGQSVNWIIQELEKIEDQKINSIYTYTHTETKWQQTFFRRADAQSLIDESVTFENDRLAGRGPAPRYRKERIIRNMMKTGM